MLTPQRSSPQQLHQGAGIAGFGVDPDPAAPQLWHLPQIRGHHQLEKAPVHPGEHPEAVTRGIVSMANPNGVIERYCCDRIDATQHAFTHLIGVGNAMALWRCRERNALVVQLIADAKQRLGGINEERNLQS